MREKYESLSVAVLRNLAKDIGIKKISSMKKADLVQALLDEEERRKKERMADQKETKQKKQIRRTEDTGDGKTVKKENRSKRQKAADSDTKAEPVKKNRRTGKSKTESIAPMSEKEEPEREAKKDQIIGKAEPDSDTKQVELVHPENEARIENDPVSNVTGGRSSDTVKRTEAGKSVEKTEDGIRAHGILEVMADGFGFIRCENYMPGPEDVYVSPSLIRRFGLKTGDIITGNMRERNQNEKFGALLFVSDVNGFTPQETARRKHFEDLTPIFPNERLRLETGTSGISMRIMDLIAPVGKGQRGMIVSPPKAGKTTLLKDVAKSVRTNNPEMYLIVLLIDERPEEVTDIKEAIEGENVEVIYSTFDELPEHHRRVSEMVIERAKRLVEMRKDVIILLDSITRLARAYNLIVPPSGRTLSGGLDPAALYMPKRFFGAARNMREGGSLTVLATALVDTGSKMDDVVYEEFKGTGNMELVLDRKLSERRIFPAIDIVKSGTRREDLLLDQAEQEAVVIMRRGINGMKTDEAVENILKLFVHTKSNRDFVNYIRKRRIF